MENSYINKLIKDIDNVLDNNKYQFSQSEISKLKKARQSLLENKNNNGESDEEKSKRIIIILKIIKDIFKVFLGDFPFGIN